MRNYRPLYSGLNAKEKVGASRFDQSENHIEFYDMSERAFLLFIKPIFIELYRVMKLGSHLYCFTDWKQLRNMADCLELASFKIVNIVCQDKGKAGGLGYLPSENKRSNYTQTKAGYPLKPMQYGFIKGFNQAKETLYTREQIKQAYMDSWEEYLQQQYAGQLDKERCFELWIEKTNLTKQYARNRIYNHMDIMRVY